MWAIKAFEHAEIYFNVSLLFIYIAINLFYCWRNARMTIVPDCSIWIQPIFFLQILCSVDTRILRLTPYDDEIYKVFREDFPKLDVHNLTDDMLKNNLAKEVCPLFVPP